MEKGVSEKQLSRDIGKSSAYLSSMNKNKSMPSTRVLIEICEYLNVSLSDFFAFDDIDHPVKIGEIRDELLKMDCQELESILQISKQINRRK